MNPAQQGSVPHIESTHGRARLRDGSFAPYRVDGPTGAPVMLLYNGLVSSDLHWRTFAAYYARRYRVVRFSYRGHDPYDSPRDLRTISIEGFADDGHHVLRHVLEQAGGGPAILCGLSMGVQAVLSHVAQHPADAAGLVLLCGTHGHPLDRLGLGERGRRTLGRLFQLLAGVGRASKILLWPFLGTPLGAELAYLSGGASRSALPEGFFRELFAHVLQMHPAVVAAIATSWINHSALASLHEISAPTLIFAGGADQLTPPSCSEQIHDAVEDSELHVVQGHTHLLQVEAPDLVHDRVDAWLIRHGL